jgi:hypothetical protein
MACYRCGSRQVDPVRGHSPWQRGVRGDQQVLICPTCQGTHDWKSDLDQCARCGGVRLVRRLGEAECRDCGSVVVAAAPAGVAAAPAGLAAVAAVGAGRDTEVPALSGLSGAEAPGLSEEVARALDRVLGRSPAGG